MCLIGKLNFIPNCVAILAVLSSGYQTLAISEMFNLESSQGYSSKKKSEYIPGSALIQEHFLKINSPVSHKFQIYTNFSNFMDSVVQIFSPERQLTTKVITLKRKNK